VPLHRVDVGDLVVEHPSVDGARGDHPVPTVVLFDLEGVLVDTLILRARAWVVALAEAGVHVPAVSVLHALARSPREVSAALLGAADRSLDYRHERAFASIAHEASPLPGAMAVLARARAGGVRVLVHASAEAPVDALLSCLGPECASPQVLEDRDRAWAGVEPHHAVAVVGTEQGARAATDGAIVLGVETAGATCRDLVNAGAHAAFEDLRRVLDAWSPETFAALAQLRADTASVDVIVEIPAGSRNKYEADPATGRLRLDRQLPRSLAYPADYGFVPDTLAEDGDELDALVLLDEPVVPGSIVRATPLGLVLVEDEHGRDPKLVAVPADRAAAEGLTDLADLPPRRLEEFEQFFRTYKRLDTGRRARVCGFGNRLDAWRELFRSRARALERGRPTAVLRAPSTKRRADATFVE